MKTIEVIMQTKCVNCKLEQYAIAVYGISHGEDGCVWCGFVPPVFTDYADYKHFLEKPIRKELTK